MNESKLNFWMEKVAFLKMILFLFQNGLEEEKGDTFHKTLTFLQVGKEL